MVAVLNPLLTFGPPALEYIGPDARAEDRKAALAARPAGAACSTHARKSTVRSTASSRTSPPTRASAQPRFLGTKVKILIVDRPSGFLMVLLLGTEEKLPEYEELLDRKQLQLNAVK